MKFTQRPVLTRPQHLKRSDRGEVSDAIAHLHFVASLATTCHFWTPRWLPPFGRARSLQKACRLRPFERKSKGRGATASSDMRQKKTWAWRAIKVQATGTQAACITISGENQAALHHMVSRMATFASESG